MAYLLQDVAHSSVGASVITAVALLLLLWLRLLWLGGRQAMHKLLSTLSLLESQWQAIHTLGGCPPAKLRPTGESDELLALGGPIKDKTLRPFRASEFFRTFFFFFGPRALKTVKKHNNLAETGLSFDFRAQIQEFHKVISFSRLQVGASRQFLASKALRSDRGQLAMPLYCLGVKLR